MLEFHRARGAEATILVTKVRGVGAGGCGSSGPLHSTLRGGHEFAGTDVAVAKHC